MSPPSSGSKNKPRKKLQAVSYLQALHSVAYMYHSMPQAYYMYRQSRGKNYRSLIMKYLTEPGEELFHVHPLSEMYRNYQTESR
jgi:hypothetical protein